MFAGDTGGDTPLADIAYDFTGGAEFLYYYHPDHLGSTGFVTDKKGELYEHIEYFPFGETWVLEGASNWKVPYMYTSKELDQDTQLYYYGARYYDPRTSVWQSADPIMEKYLPTGNKENDQNLAGMGGVFNSGNLAMYTYAHQNSVRYFDPDGKETYSFGGEAGLGAYVAGEIAYDADTGDIYLAGKVGVGAGLGIGVAVTENAPKEGQGFEVQGNLNILVAGVKAETTIDGKTKKIEGGDLEGYMPLDKNLDLSMPEKAKVGGSGSVTYKGTKKVGNLNSIVDPIVNGVGSIMDGVKALILPTPTPPLPSKPNADK